MDWQLVVAVLLFVFALASIAGRWGRMDDRRRAGVLLLLAGAALKAFVADLAVVALPVGAETITGAALIAFAAGLVLVVLGSESREGERTGETDR